MKTIVLTAAFCIASAAPLLAYDTNVLADEKSKDSYALGMMMGHTWQQQGVDVNLDLVVRGIKDEQAGGTPLMTPPEVESTLREYQQALVSRRQKIQAELGAKNKVEGAAFLITNKTNSGVVVLPDGLQYKIITDGSGPVPSATDTVTVNYRGTFIDGTEFDSSAKIGHPVQFPANHVIPGWTEALTKMKVGSKWQLFIPSELAYGAQGHPSIPPNSTLIFEVELLSIQPANPEMQPAPLTSDIIKVPSAAELKKGAKIETLKPEDVEKLQSQQTADAETYEEVTPADNLDFAFHANNIMTAANESIDRGEFNVTSGTVTEFALAGKKILLETDQITQDGCVVTKDFGRVKLKLKTENGIKTTIWLMPSQKKAFKQFASESKQ